eukprot:6107108-Prymnesium_polylepis.1
MGAALTHMMSPTELGDDKPSQALRDAANTEAFQRGCCLSVVHVPQQQLAGRDWEFHVPRATAIPPQQPAFYNVY